MDAVTALLVVLFLLWAVPSGIKWFLKLQGVAQFQQGSAEPTEMVRLQEALVELGLSYQFRQSHEWVLTGTLSGYTMEVGIRFDDPCTVLITAQGRFGLTGSIKPQGGITQAEDLHGPGADLSLGLDGLDELLTLDFPDTPQVQRFLRDPNVGAALRVLSLSDFQYVDFTRERIEAKWSIPMDYLRALLPMYIEQIYLPLCRAASPALPDEEQVPQTTAQGAPEAAAFVTMPPSADIQEQTGAPGPDGTSSLSQEPQTAPTAMPQEPQQAEAPGPAPAEEAATAGPEPGPRASAPGPSSGSAHDVQPGVEIEPERQAASWSPAVKPVSELGAQNGHMEGSKADLETLLTTADAQAVAEAARGDPNAIRLLADKLGDFSARNKAQSALVLLGGEAVPVLIEAGTDLLRASAAREVLAKGGATVRHAVANALAQETDKARIQFLLDVVDELRIQEAVPTLQALLDHEDFLVKMKAQSTLAKLGVTR